MALLLATCLLAGGIAVGATSAYMVDHGAKTNTFSVGEVQIQQSEPGFLKNTNPLQPNEEVTKDPQIENIGKSDAIVFMVVELPVEEVTLVDAEDGTRGTKEATDLFWFKASETEASAHANSWNDTNWTKLESKSSVSDTAGEASVYVFAYDQILKAQSGAESITDPLFNKIQLKSFLEGEIASNAAQMINIKTYAIQASEILSGGADLTDDFADGDASVETLEEIYEIFINQTSSY